VEELLTPVEEPAPVVHLEWDRAHEQVDAVVRAESEAAVIITVVHDLWPQPGYQWIRADEIVECDELENNSPVVRVLDALGIRGFRIDEALLSLTWLIGLARFRTKPLGLYLRRTGSQEVTVGTVKSANDAVVVLDAVNPQGAFTGEELILDLDDVIAAEWDTDYMRALALLLGTD
jgi:hypothetical protein